MRSWYLVFAILAVAHAARPTPAPTPFLPYRRALGDALNPGDTDTASKTSNSDTNSQTSATSTSATSTSATSTTSTTSTTTSTTSTSQSSATDSQPTSPTPDTQASQTTDPNANTSNQQQQQQQTTTTVVTPTGADSTSAAANSSNTAAPPKGNEGLSTGSIIGMAVAGGVAVFGIVGFFVWKFTRKRFSDFDDNEAIRWPDLNQHGGEPHDGGYPLPTNNTGRAGFGNESEASLSRSTSHTRGTPDPYAVPPLPHMNPNQPYLDDPSSAYYDPYHGPVPNSLDEPNAPHPGGWPAESIPMTQIRSQSPGPGQAYNMYEGGRASPGPGANVRSQSPGPMQAYSLYDTGRSSPAPQMGAGRRSPGPNAGLR